MNAVLRPLACVLLGAAVAAADPPPATRVVVLDNENLLEGEVSRQADGYHVRRSVGGDITLPVGRVLVVVADRKAAFAVVAERANRRDADERLRLARWCLVNDLPAEALAEAEAAARMRPGFTAAEGLARTIRDKARQPATPPPVPAVAKAPAKDEVTDVPPVEYNSESFPLFASKVNTILMNACATCHAREDVKAFRLTRLGGRSAMTKNMLAALAQVNPADPPASPILVKAVTPHGSATDAPFKTRSHPAYKTLETWAAFARAAEGTPAPAGPPEPKTLPVLGTDQPTPATPGNEFGRDSSTTPPKPPKAPGDDPFDPAAFNEGKKK